MHVARIQHSIWASGVALSMVIGPLVPNTVQAAPTAEVAYTSGTVDGLHALFAKKKRGKRAKARKRSRANKGPAMIPRKAQANREKLEAELQSAIAGEEWQTVADRFEAEGNTLGDPVLLMKSVDARLRAAKNDRSIELAEESMVTARVALDILHFYDDVDRDQASTDWYIIAPKNASSLIGQVESKVAEAESLIAEIEDERAAAAQSDDEGPPAAPEVALEGKKKTRGKPGMALIATGATFTGLAVAGAGLGIAGIVISGNKQRQVEGLTLPDDQETVDRLDREGKRANVLGYAGLGVAALGLAVGIPLIVIGVKKRKQAGDVPSNASVQVLPTMGRGEGGLVLNGRF